MTLPRSKLLQYFYNFQWKNFLYKLHTKLTLFVWKYVTKNVFQSGSHRFAVGTNGHYHHQVEMSSLTFFLVCDWSVVTNPSFWLAKTYLWSSLIGQDRALPIPGHLSQVNVSKLGVETGKGKIFSISRNVNTNSRQQQQQQQPLIASDIKFVNTARGTRGREKHNQIHV